jgi:hypothetical protein
MRKAESFRLLFLISPHDVGERHRWCRRYSCNCRVWLSPSSPRDIFCGSRHRSYRACCVVLSGAAPRHTVQLCAEGQNLLRNAQQKWDRMLKTVISKKIANEFGVCGSRTGGDPKCVTHRLSTCTASTHVQWCFSADRTSACSAFLIVPGHGSFF